jgi:serine/threonine protein kinase
VSLVRHKQTGDLYAMKSMKKKYIEKKNQIQRMMTERDILAQINHPFLIKIRSSFQDDKKLYLALEYCPGGELFGLLSKKKRLPESAYLVPNLELASMPRKWFWLLSTYTPKTSSTESNITLMQPQTRKRAHRS